MGLSRCGSLDEQSGKVSEQTFEQRPEARKGMSHGDVWGRP